RGHRRLVVAAVGRDRLQAPDRERLRPQLPEDVHDILRDPARDDDLSDLRLAGEVPVRDLDRSQLRRTDGAAGAVGEAQVVPTHSVHARAKLGSGSSGGRDATCEGRDEDERGGDSHRSSVLFCFLDGESVLALTLLVAATTAACPQSLANDLDTPAT